MHPKDRVIVDIVPEVGNLRNQIPLLPPVLETGLLLVLEVSHNCLFGDPVVSCALDG